MWQWLHILLNLVLSIIPISVIDYAKHFISVQCIKVSESSFSDRLVTPGDELSSISGTGNRLLSLRKMLPVIRRF
jgi:hypothetical protein